MHVNHMRIFPLSWVHASHIYMRACIIKRPLDQVITAIWSKPDMQTLFWFEVKYLPPDKDKAILDASEGKSYLIFICGPLAFPHHLQSLRITMQTLISLTTFQEASHYKVSNDH